MRGHGFSPAHNSSPIDRQATERRRRRRRRRRRGAGVSTGKLTATVDSSDSALGPGSPGPLPCPPFCPLPYPLSCPLFCPLTDPPLLPPLSPAPLSPLLPPLLPALLPPLFPGMPGVWPALPAAGRRELDAAQRTARPARRRRQAAKTDARYSASGPRLHSGGPAPHPVPQAAVGGTWRRLPEAAWGGACGAGQGKDASAGLGHAGVRYGGGKCLYTEQTRHRLRRRQVFIHGADKAPEGEGGREAPERVWAMRECCMRRRNAREAARAFKV